MHNRDNFELITGKAVDDSVWGFVNLFQGRLRIFMNRVTARRMFSRRFDSFNNAGHHPCSVKL